MLQKEGKSAVLAVILSLLWPGIGHFYLGSSGKGTQFLLMALGGWFLTGTLFGAIIGIPLLFITYIWAPIDANLVAKA